MRSSSLQVLAGTALASLALTGCASLHSESPSHRHWVEVTPGSPAARPPELHLKPMQLGAGDAYGKMVYARYLALRDRGDQPENARIVEVPAADTTD